MATVTTYKCDVCGVLKQEANHWFRATKPVHPPIFCLVKWEYRNPDKPVEELHLCGLQCATKAMHKAMEE